MNGGAAMTALRRIVLGIVWFFVFAVVLGLVGENLFPSPKPTSPEDPFYQGYQLFGLLSGGLSLILAIAGTLTGKLPGTGTGTFDGTRAIIVTTILYGLFMALMSHIGPGPYPRSYDIPVWVGLLLCCSGFWLFRFRNWARVTAIVLTAVLLLWMLWVKVPDFLSAPAISLFEVIPTVGYAVFAMWYFSQPKIKTRFR